ncbi:TPA: recombinase family protein [Photobacterium damselae]|uniref:resolvase n=1 Tax=Photobacterium damselae TaxID=38293 RepID=UPI0030F40F41
MKLVQHGISKWDLQIRPKLGRSELNKLIDDSEAGGVLLIEKMDRLRRFTLVGMENLRSVNLRKRISDCGSRSADDTCVFSAGEQNSITLVSTEFMLDLGAAMVRDDYETRHKRQEQGIAKAEEHRGRRLNVSLHPDMRVQLSLGRSYSEIQQKLGCAIIERMVKGSVFNEKQL